MGESHYHYAYPHGSLCNNPECPDWLPKPLPGGKCDWPNCECHSVETQMTLDEFCEVHNISDKELPHALAAWMNIEHDWDGTYQPLENYVQSKAAENIGCGTWTVVLLIGLCLWAVLWALLGMALRWYW